MAIPAPNRARFGAFDLDLKAGETRWMPEARRVTRNLAAGPLELLYIETKRPQT